jgi:sec-independent protein translocase protein TatB
LTAFPGVQAFIFDVGWGELVLIGIVALIVIGPKELPTVLRTVGQWMTKIRRMAGEFQSQFQEAMREAEMADLKQHFDAIQDAAKDIRGFDPATHIRDQVEGAAAEKPADAPPSALAPNAAPAVAPAPTSSEPTPASPATDTGSTAPAPTSAPAMESGVAQPAPAVAPSAEQPAVQPAPAAAPSAEPPAVQPASPEPGKGS